jgi:GMP synthase (glutamine-hydrolysing)
MDKDTILILDFGSQYTQLIARRIRENNTYSEIVPFDIDLKTIRQYQPKGIIFSGGPASVYKEKAPLPSKEILEAGIPILGICYGLQATALLLGGAVARENLREYGKAELFIDDHSDLFLGLPSSITSWMSHQDQVLKLPPGFVKLAHTTNSPFASIAHKKNRIYGVQFHPEVIHTAFGKEILRNFVFQICSCKGNWNIGSFLDETLQQIKKKVDNAGVICGLSGGVDSSVTAVLVNRAIGKQLTCIFVNNGFLRKNEANKVVEIFKDKFQLNLHYVDAQSRFLENIKGVLDPEEKRKVIGKEFIRVFEEKASSISNTKYLAQGTLYPDVIESRSFFGGPSAKIKTHHNVGGLPEKMSLELIEPLRELFKDEVRLLGRLLGLPEEIIERQPFPGPGLAVRIIGEVNLDRLNLLREADHILLEEIKNAGLYQQLWQSFAVLLPIKSVGVMGDERTYENVLAIRAVTSSDGMTADWAQLPYELLQRISNKIINEVRGINRVVYDISSKPPATIEWE